VKWHFAAAVFKLNDHPMAWLLAWGGVTPERPWWDKWLLVIAGLLFVVCGMGVILTADNYSSPPTWIIAACGYVVVLVLFYVALRRLEKWQLNKTVEKLRHAFHFD
jgi:peptidoglycan/LPS O-acetylase OafA/YrhL